MAGKRKRGSGSLIHRKDGRWEGRYVIGYDEKHHPITKNVLAKTKSECGEKLKQLKAQYEKPKEEKMSSAMTFGAWLDYWYQTCKKPAIRPNTQSCYEQRIYDHIIPHMGTLQLNRLTQADFQHFYTVLKKNGRRVDKEEKGNGLSDETVRGCHSTCRAALDAAVEKKLIKRNPAKDAKIPSATRYEMQTLDAEEMQRLLIQAKEDGCYELLLLDLGTGLRRGELCALQWRDLNAATGELRIERQVHRIKGKLVVSPLKTDAANRSIILPPSLLSAILEYRKTVHSRWMFPSPRKEDAPRDPAAVRKRLSIVLERAGCKHIRFHDLRHTFATTALGRGMDVKTLSAIIGHATSATTLNIYAHTNKEMQQAAARKIDRHIVKSKTRQFVMPAKTPRTTFQAQKGKIRKPGTGCVSRLSDHLWEGRYTPTWPDGKRRARNVYAKTEAECEALLAELIRKTKAEIAEERAG